MTLEEAITLQPPWVGYWLYWLTFGGLFLPLTLLIWKQTRLAAALAVASVVAGALGVSWLYGHMGYVKLLGLPHILFWTPLAVYFYRLIRREDMPPWPRRIMIVVLSTILISLAFDYTDALRYLLGERTPLAAPT
jgi:hypothetical protein